MNSKEFEKILHIDNFNLLDTEYTKTKDFFLNLKGQITCKEVSEKFPAFCFAEKEIRIKFPTYFIRIVDEQISYSELKDLLKNQSNYLIYEEPNVIKPSTYASVSSIAIHCLKSSLSENERLAEQIENILNYKNIRFERCVSSRHYVIPINVDKDGYIHIL